MDELELEILHHDGRRERRRLEVGSWGIGRDRGNWLSPVDPSLSRRHALLEVGSDGVWVEALPSRNGTTVDGETLKGRRRIAVGTTVGCGATMLRLVAATGSGDLRDAPTRDLDGSALGSGLIARSTAMQRLVETAERIAGSELPVLIRGESGAGKEVVAGHLHRHSAVADGPFEVLNCPALPESLIEAELFGVEAGVATEVRARPGLLEAADGGTLLLDEIADLPLPAQAKLLRFLADSRLRRVGGREERELRVRILAASNKDLAAEIEAGRFRADLYYRIAGLELVVPPLRERREDIAPLAREILRLQGGKPLADAALDRLEAYAFPGNVRELEAILRRASVLGDGPLIEVADLGLDGVEAEDSARRLEAGLEDGSVDFWRDLHRPYMARELSRERLAEVVELGLRAAGGKVTLLAERWRTEDRYRKLLDFLRNQGFLGR